ncbi:transposase [Rhodococcus sp. F64268]|uniref:RNA-guided endonuclease InsQ/TnpB family protein n=1 Tax=unclassified Rhodococcus (in: high G+C Gram-positive bacteria) TaxID=192944 RepID=UPI001FF17D5F|nr:transposase [Rhodococcus sp. F64268]MCK0091712.1 transposase [Rhodococcus sp. F64268]
MLKRYRCRAYPTGEQHRALSRLFGCCRVVFNDALAARESARRAGRPIPSKGELSAALTAAKATPERAWLAEVSSVPLQQSLADLHRAYANFFDSHTGKRKGRKVGAPRFKRRTHRQSARFTRNAGFGVLEPGAGAGFVRLPKIGRVRYESSRPLPADPSSVTVIREADGRHYVSFVVDEPAPAVVPASPARAAGVDVGLTDLATIVYDDGTREKIDNPRWLRSKERGLARAQRAYSRTMKGSKNRDKARRKVAAAHRKVRETRLDHHHKLALRLVRENQAVALEGLSVAGLARTRLAKSVHDAGWSTLRRLIEEKAARYGAVVHTISQWEPTSQVCAGCGVRDGKKPLDVRVWVCSSCGLVLDRDYNAAVNVMLAAGLVERVNACGGSVRRVLACADPVKQEPAEQILPDGEAA